MSIRKATVATAFWPLRRLATNMPYVYTGMMVVGMFVLSTAGHANYPIDNAAPCALSLIFIGAMGRLGLRLK